MITLHLHPDHAAHLAATPIRVWKTKRELEPIDRVYGLGAPTAHDFATVGEAVAWVNRVRDDKRYSFHLRTKGRGGVNGLFLFGFVGGLNHEFTVAEVVEAIYNATSTAAD